MLSRWSSSDGAELVVPDPEVERKAKLAAEAKAEYAEAKAEVKQKLGKALDQIENSQTRSVPIACLRLQRRTWAAATRSRCEGGSNCSAQDVPGSLRPSRTC